MKWPVPKYWVQAILFDRPEVHIWRRRRFKTNIPHQKITTDTTEFKYYEVDSKGHMTTHKLYLDPFLDMCNGELLWFA